MSGLAWSGEFSLVATKRRVTSIALMRQMNNVEEGTYPSDHIVKMTACFPLSATAL
jgi:hypothetical protein